MTNVSLPYQFKENRPSKQGQMRRMLSNLCKTEHSELKYKLTLEKHDEIQKKEEARKLAVQIILNLYKAVKSLGTELAIVEQFVPGDEETEQILDRKITEALEYIEEDQKELTDDQLASLITSIQEYFPEIDWDTEILGDALQADFSRVKKVLKK